MSPLRASVPGLSQSWSCWAPIQSLRPRQRGSVAIESERPWTESNVCAHVSAAVSPLRASVPGLSQSWSCWAPIQSLRPRQRGSVAIESERPWTESNVCAHVSAAVSPLRASVPGLSQSWSCWAPIQSLRPHQRGCNALRGNL